MTPREFLILLKLKKCIMMELMDDCVFMFSDPPPRNGPSEYSGTLWIYSNVGERSIEVHDDDGYHSVEHLCPSDIEWLLEIAEIIE